MSFSVAADSYDRFMGVYARPLARLFADFAGVRPGMRVLDVGCGPGALTGELAGRLGPAAVVAVDPESGFVTACRERHPGVDVRIGAAEALPFGADEFGAVLAQLVVHFMPDPVAGLRDLARVAVPGGAVAACVWDHAGGAGPLSAFWSAVADVDPGSPGERGLPGTREGHLAELAAAAGLVEIESGRLDVAVEYDSTDAWWEPFLLGVGPAGGYVVGLDAAERARLRAACERRLPAPPFTITATAWAVRARSAPTP